ncbi:methionyl-tRNA formyltransferase [Sulfurifustis variabilis]|uniref:Methionyl-tRNA formyltransferase n=1 Tax=Sulfurifustis variabilis TaxID=1675686 RepID=A0A1B4V032_9GAMM|nr:methionyl-tRNA formyltransferase [Sulfurifustis variabilis]BAU46603.1 methionyl-tRNA formyltransferase [Sulfurifustis variabilis]
MRLVFAGTPAFALPTLEALLAAGHDIRAVYTQPDRPAGRGRRLSESPIKKFALTHSLPLYQPPTLTGIDRHLAPLEPDVAIVVAYGLILPPAMLALPRFGCVNVHASLLPRWRGAAPVARAIEAGDRVTGVTIMQMEAGLDTGPMLAQAEVPILDSDTSASLESRLAPLGAELMVHTLNLLGRGGVRARAQDDAAATYAPKLRKSEATVDWTRSAESLHRKIRAFNPYPVASTLLRGEPLRLWEVGPLDDGEEATPPTEPGTVLDTGAAGIRVQTGGGSLLLTRLQVAGGKVLEARDFLNGTRLAPGDRLGS